MTNYITNNHDNNNNNTKSFAEHPSKCVKFWMVKLPYQVVGALDLDETRKNELYLMIVRVVMSRATLVPCLSFFLSTYQENRPQFSLKVWQKGSVDISGKQNYQHPPQY